MVCVAMSPSYLCTMECGVVCASLFASYPGSRDGGCRAPCGVCLPVSYLFPMIDQRCVLLDWNVRGLNSAARRKVVRDLVQETGASIVCLQETKMQLRDRSVVVESVRSDGEQK